MSTSKMAGKSVIPHNYPITRPRGPLTHLGRKSPILWAIISNNRCKIMTLESSPASLCRPGRWPRGSRVLRTSRFVSSSTAQPESRFGTCRHTVNFNRSRGRNNAGHDVNKGNRTLISATWCFNELRPVIDNKGRDGGGWRGEERMGTTRGGREAAS